AFSIRVLDSFSTSLSPEVVEALICCEDWIRSSDSELVADGEDEGDEVVFQNVYAAFQAQSASAPAGPSGSSRAGASGSSPTTHVLIRVLLYHKWKKTMSTTILMRMMRLMWM
ncbi:unnamed protein product, partial [Linum tenue]